jgi:hypothetical protein
MRHVDPLHADRAMMAINLSARSQYEEHQQRMLGQNNAGINDSAAEKQNRL